MLISTPVVWKIYLLGMGGSGIFSTLTTTPSGLHNTCVWSFPLWRPFRSLYCYVQTSYYRLRKCFQSDILVEFYTNLVRGISILRFEVKVNIVTNLLWSEEERGALLWLLRSTVSFLNVLLSLNHLRWESWIFI